ncbi:ROK family protein [Nonomuraea cypriaca]|uniref:ROK family protein n=1 Tax=Nonomuraea cypriaca TaxID=1187855 RepID=UPI001A9CB209|nr:ROK family protein [Nonomuraea cypriaca]
MQGRDLAALRRFNTSAVLRALRKQGPQSLTLLKETTGLSRPTVELALEELSGQGWVAEIADAPATRSPGRPARRFRFRGEAGRVVGVDIGLHKIVLLLSDLTGEILAVERESIDSAMDGADRLAFLRTRLERFLAGHGVHQRELWAVSVAVPGFVDEAGRVHSIVVPEWNGLDLANRLAETFRCHVVAENDVNFAAVAEHWRGAARLADDVACVLAGRRASCGLLLGGRLHRGRRGGAGELGTLPHLGLAAAHQALRWDGVRSGESAIEALVRAAEAEDPRALEVLDAYAARLAPGVAALVLAVDPDLIVLCGGVTPAGRWLTPMLTRHLRDITLHVPRIAVSTLGERGVALGAVRTGLDHVDTQLTDPAGPLPSAAR